MFFFFRRHPARKSALPALCAACTYVKVISTWKTGANIAEQTFTLCICRRTAGTSEVHKCLQSALHTISLVFFT